MNDSQVTLERMQTASNEGRKIKLLLELQTSKISSWIHDVTNDLQGSVDILNEISVD